MARAGMAYGQIKAGELAKGMAALTEAVAWFEKSNLHFTRSSWGLRLAEGYIKTGERERARLLVTEILGTCRESGHRHLQGVAERLLGEILAADDPSAAASQLEAAVRTLEDVGARDELARAFVAQASLRGEAGDRGGARRLLERALALFEELGTLDEPKRVRVALAALDQAAWRRDWRRCRWTRRTSNAKVGVTGPRLSGPGRIGGRDEGPSRFCALGIIGPRHAEASLAAHSVL